MAWRFSSGQWRAGAPMRAGSKAHAGGYRAVDLSSKTADSSKICCGHPGFAD